MDKMKESQKKAGRGGLSTTHFVAGCAARLEQLRVMAAAVQQTVSAEVDEVDQQLAARATHEAGGVPAFVGPGPGGEHRHLSACNPISALQGGRHSISQAPFYSSFKDR